MGAGQADIAPVERRDPRLVHIDVAFRADEHPGGISHHVDRDGTVLIDDGFPCHVTDRTTGGDQNAGGAA